MRFFERPSAGPEAKRCAAPSRGRVRAVEARRKEAGPAEIDRRAPDAPPSERREAVSRPRPGGQGFDIDRISSSGPEESWLDRLEERV